MRVRERILFLTVPVSILAVAACATTQLKEQWRDPAYRAADAQQVLVIAIMSSEERRRVFEDEFVARLAKANAAAKPSYPQLPVNGPKNLDAVRRVVEKTGATLVLSVRLVGLEQETVVSGGYIGPLGFAGYYPNASANIYYYPPDVHSYRIFRTETRVFDMKSDKLVWSAIMETDEPSDFNAAAAQYVDLAVKQMQYNKILGNR